MKSVALVAAAAAGLGALAGAGMGYFEARPWTVAPLRDAPPADASQAPQAAPRAILAETTFQFGKMEQGSSMTHDFVVRNAGEAPLVLSYVSHTCKCTAVLLDGSKSEPGAQAAVAPGAAAKVSLEWVAKTEAGPFRHGATFGTSDPGQPRFELVVEGDVVESTTLRPASIYFDGARVGEPTEQSLMVLAYLESEVRVTARRLSVPAALEPHLSVRVEPVEAAEFPEPHVQSAARVVVRLEPSGFVGPFQGALELETNLPQAAKLTVPLGGTIKGDVSIYGQGWHAQAGLLKIGAVSRAEGGRAQLNVMIRGEHAAATAVSVVRVDPPELRAELGTPVSRGPALVQVPLTVAIPAGTPPMVRAGEDQGGEGEIVLGTTHPQTGEVKLRVQFAVKP
jgi:hypothetical protein